MVRLNIQYVFIFIYNYNIFKTLEKTNNLQKYVKMYEKEFFF